MNLQPTFRPPDPMGPDELRDHLAHLGLTQHSASKFLGISDATVRNWAAGKLPVSPPTATLLRLMVNEDLSPHDVVAILSRAPSRS